MLNKGEKREERTSRTGNQGLAAPGHHGRQAFFPAFCETKNNRKKRALAIPEAIIVEISCMNVQKVPESVWGFAVRFDHDGFST